MLGMLCCAWSTGLLFMGGALAAAAGFKGAPVNEHR